jgi:hypothetical protein
MHAIQLVDRAGDTAHQAGREGVTCQTADDAMLLDARQDDRDTWHVLCLSSVRC